jgi:hypothetical protein
VQGPILNTQATHIVSYLKMRKLRPRVLRWLTQRHTARSGRTVICPWVVWLQGLSS